MKRTILAGIVCALAGMGSIHAASQEPSSLAPAAGSQHSATLNKYCITCHNDKLKTADLILSKLDIDNPNSDPATWEKVVRKLRTRAMPPAGMPRPDAATYDSFAAYLETALDQAAAAQPNPGRPADHRLNRAEYANAIRDLLGLEIDGPSLLPADEVSNGFDNIGDVLSVSPLLMERYLFAAGKISRLAIGDPTIKPGSEEYKVSEFLLQNDRESEDLPFGSRGGIAVRHNFPLDGEYVIRIRLQRNNDGFIRGLNEPHLMDVRVGGERVKLFTVGGVHKGKSGPLFTRNDPDYRGDPVQVAYEMSGDEALEVRFPAKAGPRLVGVAFLKENVQPEGVLMGRMLLRDVAKYRGGDPGVEAVTVLGPFNPNGSALSPSRRKIFVCTPPPAAAGSPAKLVSLTSGSANEGNADEESCARKVVTSLARRAYRRTPTNVEIQDLINVYRTGRKGGNFDAGIQLALQRILAGPEFLFRVERDPADVPLNSVYKVNDFELASRLSFFLWSSIPDGQLLDAAEQGKLRDPKVLEQQVRRMLADSRSSAMVTNFAGQWLDVRNINNVSPDPRVYPDFDDELRAAFQQETLLFFESLLRDDRPVLDLLRANYTFVNERLARHYGIPNIFGSSFRRVTVTDETRFGLLGQGTLLTATSRANRTSPVLRGKWVLENLLGAPPPPPPPDVPAGLKPKNAEGKELTMREQLDEHRNNPACSVCHNRMDPIGFSLDNFNGVGQWRTMDAGTPLDVSGVLYDGTKFQGPAELRKILLGRPRQIAQTVTEKLFTYALGRGLDYYDEPAVRKILQEAGPSEYRWSSLIVGIVNSTPFQMRRSREQ